MPLQATSGAASYDGFGGGVAAVPNYIEEVFSTWLYTGNASLQTITNNIDLSTKGGLVWVKGRSVAGSNTLYDTERGIQKQIFSESTSGTFPTSPASGTSQLYAFNNNGFSLGADDGSNTNTNNQTFASWTFRKQPKFFDIVTYTGTSSPAQIAHNLGSAPGCVIIKRTNTTGQWAVWHRSGNQTNGQFGAFLNATDPYQNVASNLWGSSSSPPDMNASTFGVGTAGDTNSSGSSYVAYIFAHDAGGFGLTGTDNVISCGSYTGNGTANTLVTLGYEPQWVLVKNSSGSPNDWFILDNMRGYAYSSQAYLRPNLSDAESTSTTYHVPSATGFTLLGTGNPFNNSGTTYIYIAIRRGPMKVPTDATKVFLPIAYAGNSSLRNLGGVLNPVDMFIGGYRNRSGFGANINASRLTGRLRNLVTATTAAEVVTADNTSQPIYSFAFQDTFQTGTGNELNGSGYNYVMWQMRRAPSFFDQVCYTGTGVTRTITHNLAAVPELIIVKSRSRSPSIWAVYSVGTGNTKYLELQATTAAVVDGIWNNTTPTSTVFSVDNGPSVNDSGSTYVAYLFATCAGVSKVGSYTGTGATQTIACGFTGGARFVLIKRTDSTGDWYVWDTARGMVSGTDPSTLLNVEAAEVNANSVYTIATGFQIVSTAAGINASGGSYIFLAIA
jgi:hypothetical protein